MRLRCVSIVLGLEEQVSRGLASDATRADRPRDLQLLRGEIVAVERRSPPRL